MEWWEGLLVGVGVGLVFWLLMEFSQRIGKPPKYPITPDPEFYEKIDWSNPPITGSTVAWDDICPCSTILMGPHNAGHREVHLRENEQVSFQEG